MASIFRKLIMATPGGGAGVYIKGLSLMTITALSVLGLLEMVGTHLGYSKFSNFVSQNRLRVSSRAGMLLCYTPSFLAALASFFLLDHNQNDLRFLLLTLALTLHYFKRIFEVLFIHKYSGKMAFDSAILISLSYFSSTANMIYCHYKLYYDQQPSIDIKYIGVMLFFIGIIGNFYHHCLLSQLRRKGSDHKESYKIPKGGLFGLVICPHYLFEILGFVGISFISQTLYAFSFTTGTIFYLVGRSYATRKWYISKFEDFPKELKVLIPFVF